MLQFSVYMIPRQPLFEIKAVINFSVRTNIDEKETFATVDVHAPQFSTGGAATAKLELMRDKLEHIIPASYKTKYRINKDQLIASTITHLPANQAQRMTQKMEEFIYAAAHALHLK